MTIETYQSPDWTVITTEHLKALEAVVEAADEYIDERWPDGVAFAVANKTQALLCVLNDKLAALKELE